MLNALKRDWERRKCPPDLPHLLGKPLIGYKFLKVFQVAGISPVKSTIPIKRCKEVEKASKYIEYLARDRSMPYILSTDRDVLMDILQMGYSSHVHEASHTLIRDCLAMVTLSEGWAIPASGFDNRRTFVEEGKIDTSQLPNWSWLLNKTDYESLVKKEEQCFISALTQTQAVRYTPTS